MVRTSVCPLDCPDACGMLVDIEDGRATKLRGQPEHPVTQGFLCAKVTTYLDRQYSPRRVLYPQVRVGTKGDGHRFQRVSWDEAFAVIANRLRRIVAEHGAQAILPYSYAGTMGLLNNASMDRRFFHRLGASRLERTICSSTGGAALTASQGSRYGTEPEQFAHSNFIIVWACNVHATNVHQWPFIVEARRRGAQLVVIDPVKTRTAALADRHFAIYPGSDHALALGLAHVILREGLHDHDYVAAHANGLPEVAAYTPECVARLTGMAAEDIVWLARAYATTRPAAIKLGYGVQRGEFGGAAVQAIAALPVLTGSWQQVGGGLQLTTSQAFAFDRTTLERADLQPGPTRLLNMSQLGPVLHEVSDPPVKALVVYNSNPAAVAPDQNAVLRGLAREDLFTVVLEQMHTDTANYADVLLPATTFLEHTDLYYGWGHHFVQMARPVIQPEGESKPNLEIFRQLAFHMGFDEACFSDTDEDLIRTALGSGHPHMEGITLERLQQEPFVRLNVPDPYLPYASGFDTANGKFEFGRQEYAPAAESRSGDRERLRRFPLELIPSKRADNMNSTFGFRRAVDHDAATIHMNTADAKPRQIKSGDSVTVHNDRGELRLTAEVGDGVRPGAVQVPAVRWGPNVNALTSSRLNDMGGGATFFSCLVEVKRCDI